MAEERKEDSGMLVRDEQGSMYYLRPEILEACKVREIQFTPSPGSRQQASVLGELRFEKALDKDIARILKDKAASTVMCPW
jgi:hypothetical protein